MKINNIKLSGWRSFSYTKAEKFEDINRINIIIGPNNAGKSNVFKYFYQIREMSKNTTSHLIRSQLERYDQLNCIAATFSDEDTWGGQKNNINCEISFRNVLDQFFGDSIPKLHQQHQEIILRAEHDLSQGKTCLSLINQDGIPILEPFKQKPNIFDSSVKNYINVSESSEFILDTITYWETFLKSLVFVDPLRHYSRQKIKAGESDFDGSDIVDKIISLKNNDSMEWRELKKNLERWLKSILNEDKIEFDPTDSQLRFYITRGDFEIPAFLENLGTGVAQLVMLLSYLYINRNRVLNVFMEEPESNLHPEAVIQLVRIIEENFQNHCFFITTHSSTLLDQMNENWSIHRVMLKEFKYSIVLPCNEILHQNSLLDELGIRASQMLQSNLIIWVEGPSDRIYLKKWIETKYSFIEGKHYSFLLYGGSNLANYTLVADSDYIDLLKTSRYSIIVCDSDKDSESGEYKNRVTRIANQLKQTDGMEDFVLLWVTSGREIENNIPSSLMIGALTSDSFLRKYVQVIDDTGKKINKKIKFNNDSIECDKFKSFDDFYASKYIYEDGSQLEDEQVKKISADMSKKKTGIAQYIVDNWTISNFDEELMDRIDEIIGHIKKANNIRLI